MTYRVRRVSRTAHRVERPPRFVVNQGSGHGVLPGLADLDTWVGHRRPRVRAVPIRRRNTMARNVVVATFGSLNQAHDAARDVGHLSNDVADVMNAAIVEKDRLGNTRVLDTTSRGGPSGAAVGAAGGALVGALAGLLAGPVAAAAAVGSAMATGAATGALGGGAVGAVLDATNQALNDDVLDQVGAWLKPGRWALVMEIEEDSTAAVDEVVLRHTGVVHRIPLRS
jgi:uncharacterized membrane protein